MGDRQTRGERRHWEGKGGDGIRPDLSIFAIWGNPAASDRKEGSGLVSPPETCPGDNPGRHAINWAGFIMGM